MIEVLGAALLLVACGGLGFQAARLYRDRPKHISGLHHAVRVLQSEIEYSVTPLSQALERVGARTPQPISSLFETAGQVLQQNDVSVTDAFDVAIDRSKDKSALKTPDYDIIREFANTLGRADRAHQSQEIVVTLSRLETALQEATESQRRNEKLCQYLGILTGIAIVILLYRG